MRARKVSASHLSFHFPALAGAFMIALGATAACSDDAKTAAPVDDAGADVTASSTEAKQKGRIVDAVDRFGVGNATVTVAGKSVMTNADGTYEIIVPKNVPYFMSVSEPEHFKTNEQEWIVKTDLFDRTDTSILSTSIGNILASFLPQPRDTAKGILVVRVTPIPPCDSEQGATVTIEPVGTSKATYFSNGRPDKSQMSTVKDEPFSVAFSDVDVGVPIKANVKSPTCEEVPFPVDYQGVTYTGLQTTEAGEVLSYIRVFVGPKKAGDGG